MRGNDSSNPPGATTGDVRSPGATALACLALAFAAFSFAVSHVVGRGARAEAPPVGLSFWRWLGGALLLLPVIYPRLRVSAPLILAHLRSFALLGCLMLFSTTLMLVGVHFTTAVNSSIINATQPVFTVLLAALLLRDRPRPMQLAGVALGLVGVTAMLTAMDPRRLLGLQFNGGDLLVLLAAVSAALYALSLRKIPAGLTPAETLFAIIVTGCLALAPAYVAETLFYKPVPFTAPAVSAIAVLALATSVLGMLAWNYGNRAIGPGRAALFVNLVPIFAALLAVTLLGERLHVYHVICAALIAAGIFLALRPASG